MRKACDNLEESFRNYISKFAKNCVPSVEPVQENKEQVSGLKLSFTIDPSGAMSLKPAEPASMGGVQASEDPEEKWKHWVRKIVKKLNKKGVFEGNTEFSFEILEESLLNKNPESIKEYLLPILETLPSAGKVLRRWNKKWNKLQAKTNRTISIRFGTPDPVVATPPIHEPQPPKVIEPIVEEEYEEKMNDVFQPEVIISQPEEQVSTKVKLTLGDVTHIEPIPDTPKEETKVVIKGVDIMKMLNEEKHNRLIKPARPKGALSITLRSPESFQKITALISASQQMQPDEKMKESYSVYNEFPIDLETRESINKYITRTLGKLKRDVEAKKKEKKVEKEVMKTESMNEAKKIDFHEFRIA